MNQHGSEKAVDKTSKHHSEVQLTHWDTVTFNLWFEEMITKNNIKVWQF